jgi:predicted nucleic acid-binding protein
MILRVPYPLITSKKSILGRFTRSFFRKVALILLDNTVDESAARAYGPIRAQFKERSKGALDKLIAAHAVSINVILVTNNEADFVGYEQLGVENWAKTLKN